MDGSRDVLGMWFQEIEGAKFWMQVLVRRGAKESNGGARPSSSGRFSGWLEAEGSLIRETPRRWQAALTTTGLAGTARRLGPGKRDGKVYVRNQRVTAPHCIPLETWRICAGRRHNPAAGASPPFRGAGWPTQRRRFVGATPSR